MSAPSPAQQLIATRAEAALRGGADGVTIIKTGPRDVQVDVRRGGQSWQARHTTHPHTQVMQVQVPDAPPLTLNAPDAADLLTWGLHSPETRWATLIHAADRWSGHLELLCGLLSLWLRGAYGAQETGRYVPATFAQGRWEVRTSAGPAPLVITTEWVNGALLWTADHPNWTFSTRTLKHLREQLSVHLNAS